jgi:hypothetical protein
MFDFRHRKIWHSLNSAIAADGGEKVIKPDRFKKPVRFGPMINLSYFSD